MLTVWEKGSRLLKRICLCALLIVLFGLDASAEDDIQEESNLLGNEDEILTVEQNSSLEYKITLSSTVIPEEVRSVIIPVWSKVNGQDDIKWYVAQEQSDGSYVTIFNLANHKGLGEYNIHAYAVMNDGKYVFLGVSSLTVLEPKIENVSIINYDDKNGTFRVALSGISDGNMVKKILVPVWSDVDGQDDIIWYEAKKDGSGEYYVDVDIKKHKYSMGIYYIHVYVEDITNYQFFACSTQQEVVKENGDFTITKNSEKEYIIHFQGVKVPGGVTQILFPVWSSANGQDDVKWYTATKENGGSYKCKVSVVNHKNLGEFLVHAYAKMPNNSLVYVGNTAFTTGMPSVGDVEATITNKEIGQFQIKISGVENEELIQKIYVPVWSAADQNDIIWYIATKGNKGEYIVNVDISNHKYNCNKYNIHVYTMDVTGRLKYAKATTCNLSPEYSTFIAKDINGRESVFRATLSGLKVPAGVKNVQFAVWGNVNGQNDVRWYTATKNSDGSYSYDISITNHKELGMYSVHAYCTTQGNSLKYISAAEFEVTARPTVAQIQVSDINGTTGTFKVTVSGVLALSGVEKVQIPIWCSNNQSDIVWYTATKSSEGVYTVIVKVSNHAHHFGDYKVHVYITMGNGIMTFGGSTTTNIQAHNYVYSIPISSTQQEVGIIGVANATRIEFPTWSNINGQDDIIWYDGTNCGNGKWNTVVDTARHISGGEYTTHVYVTSDGNLTCVGYTTYSLVKIATEQSLMAAKANLYSSSTGYLVLVNRNTHKVGVFQGWQGNWNCVQYWDCSDGAPSTPTVEGVFRVGSRGYYFDSGASRCYWYTQFYGNYLFHSVLYNKNGTLQDGRVGMALSHGCVRLQIENAKWIYDTIPSGTTVVVYH